MAACPDCGFEPVRVGLLQVRPGERVYAQAFQCDGCGATREIGAEHGELQIVCRDMNVQRVKFFIGAGLIWFVSTAAVMFVVAAYDLHRWLIPIVGFGGLLCVAFLTVRKIQATVFK